MRIFACLSFFALLLGASAVAANESALTILNHTPGEVLNILVRDKSGNKPLERFIRLDIAPGAQAEVENPLSEGSIRIDNGFALTEFSEVNLADAKRLTLSGNNAEQLEIDAQSGDTRAYSGKVSHLVPAPGEKIVCELSRFRPKMPMADVCHILPSETPVDDNGALLTGLGFAGLLWAGRLTPEARTTDPGKALLEHMELWRPLERGEALALLEFLFSQGYVPWQAEMPAAELDFAAMPDKNPDVRRKTLLDVLNRYFEKNTGEAAIMLAPKDILQDLANSDEPERDVQLFTLVLKPESRAMILDVAAYEGKS